MWFSGRLQELISYSKAASVFIFGAGYMEHDFAFKVLLLAFCLFSGVTCVELIKLTYIGLVVILWDIGKQQ